MLGTFSTRCFPNEKEREAAKQTEPDSHRCKNVAYGFKGMCVENKGAGENCKCEHFGDTADGTADARTCQCVCPSVCRVSVCALQGIGEETARHDSDRHPEGEHPSGAKVNPKGVFNDAVSEGI